MTTLRIAQTWDGQPIPDEQVATVRISADGDSALIVAVDAPFSNDPPPPGAPGPLWGLWDYEVVELFVLGADERYTEIELSPWGHHLVLRLEGRREVVERELPLSYSAEIVGERWTGRARVPRSLLPPGPHRGNAYAIRGVGVGRRYLAWAAVPGPAPDFHRLERFLDLALPA